jgi:peptide/nickel transport system ATP-binding protein
MNPAPPPVIDLRDVRRTYHLSAGFLRARRALHAVNGVTLSVAKGAVLGLVGESGCGKTTLARILLGLLPPTSGEIRFDGEPIGTIGRKALARRVQPIFQDPYSSLNPRKKVGSIIALPLRVHRVGDPAGWPRRVEELMDRVGLSRRLVSSYPNQLSGGQRQRVAIARALVMNPEVVVCDEPTSALDVSVQSQILNLLQDLQREFDLTYVLITHNLAVVQHMATRVAVMYLGRIVEEGPSAELFRQPRHPYTRALLASVLTPEPGKGLPDTHLGLAYPNPVSPPSGCTFHPRCPDCMDICRRVPPTPTARDGVRVECHLYDPPPQEAP